MHPSRAFAWEDAAALRAFVEARAFALLAGVAEGRPITAQAPVVWGADGSLRFHLARNNAIVPHLAGASIVASIVGEDFYVSPDWYGSADQVPTWNYRLVEVEGIARRLDEAELADQLDRLSAVHEAALAPKPAWTSAKLSPARRAALLNALAGFAIDAPVVRGVAKLGQNKSAAERAGVAAALAAIGRDDAARCMEIRK